MTQSKSDIEELKDLQREAIELKAQRKKSRSSASSAQAKHSEEEESGNASNNPSSKVSTDNTQAEGQLPDAEEAIENIADQFESFVKQLANAAQDRPALALLATFTAGVMVGYMLSRK